MKQKSNKKTPVFLYKADIAKPKNNLLVKRNTFGSTVKRPIRPISTSLTLSRSNCKTFDSKEFNLDFIAIKKSEYNLVPKQNEIDEAKERRMISFLQNSIVQDSHSGKYTIDTHQLPCNQLYYMTNINSNNKFDEFSHSSRNSRTSNTTTKSIYSNVTMHKKKATSKVIQNNCNKSSSLVNANRLNTQIKRINLDKHTLKYIISPKIKSERLNPVNKKNSHIAHDQIDKLIINFFNQKGYKV